jgi:hypothetical protein
MKTFSQISAPLIALAGLVGSASAADCLKASVKASHTIKASPAKVLEIVESEILASSDCACELTKAAIQATEAEPELVAAIVETAMMSAPDKMRLVAQCAIAVAPDSLSEVQAVLIRLQPSSGEAAPVRSAKSAKSPKQPLVEVKPAWNPLDFPAPTDAPGQPPTGLPPIGPPPGTGNPGGLPIPIPPVPPVIVPPVIVPPSGTPTNP